MLGEVLKVMGNSVAQFHIHRYPVSSPTYKPEFHFPESEYPMISCQPNIQTQISFSSPDINQNLIYLFKKNQNIHRYPVSPDINQSFIFQNIRISNDFLSSVRPDINQNFIFLFQNIRISTDILSTQIRIKIFFYKI